MKSLFVILLTVTVLFVVYCDKDKKPQPTGTQAEIEEALGREFPIVYYWNDRVVIRTWATSDTTMAKVYEPGPTFDIDTTEAWKDFTVTNKDVEFIARLSTGTQVEIWRVDWRPVGYDCYYYLYGGMIPVGGDKYHLPHSGVIHVKMFGLELGDGLLFWRSHPWPGDENIPEVVDSLCMIPVQEDIH